jgi:hypothetical protein
MVRGLDMNAQSGDMDESKVEKIIRHAILYINILRANAKQSMAQANQANARPQVPSGQEGTEDASHCHVQYSRVAWLLHRM